MRTAVLGLLLSMSTACAAIDDINLFTVEEDIELGRQLKAEIEANPADYPVLDPSAYPEAYDHLYRIADEVLAVRLLLGTEAGSPFHESGNGSTWTAMQVVDVDGRSIRLALTKEGS